MSMVDPTDAEHRDLKSGQKVSVRSRVGCVELPIEISEEMMPGVVSIPHGWGHNRLGIQLEVAQQHAGESINDLTDNLAIDALCGTAAFNGTWVSVEAASCGRRTHPLPRLCENSEIPPTGVGGWFRSGLQRSGNEFLNPTNGSWWIVQIQPVRPR